MYALIRDNTIEETRHTLPATWEHDGQLWDIRPGQHPPEAAGWHKVVETARPEDTDTHTHERTIRLIDGVPTVVWSPRAWEEGEILARAEAAAMLTDLEARVSAIEAHMWPPAGPDAPAGAAPTWDQLQPPHHWMPGTLLSDGGKVWRNVAGTILTTPPSQFPGTPAAWGHLFVEHTGTVEPEPGPGGDIAPWDPDATYTRGDQDIRVTHKGRIWLLIHSQASPGWEPGDPAMHAVWRDDGPA